MKITWEFDGPDDPLEAKELQVKWLEMLAFVLKKNLKDGDHPSCWSEGYGVHHEDGHSFTIAKVQQ